jgi:ectoine hydroxylase-related dioxygenase (phytanoyl-CoA dioxygenase family)
MVALRRLAADDVEAVRTAVDADGACIVEGLLTDAVCERLLADFATHLDAQDWGVDELGYREEFYGTRTKRLHGLFSKSPLMAAVLTHPLLVGLAENMFVSSELAHEVRLSNAELMVLTAGQGNQDFHTDAVSWRRVQAREDGEILISANIALTDFTATNGATRVVPGSHRWEAGRAPKDEEVCLAEMKRGSALIYSGNAIHSGGASTEEAARVGLYLGYIPSWLKPIENHLVTNAPDDVHALPEAAQRLLDVVPGGFAVYA